APPRQAAVGVERVPPVSLRALLRRRAPEPLDPVPVVAAVGAVHREVPYAAGPKLEGACRGREGVGTPPLRQVPDVSKGLEDQPPGPVNSPREHDLPVSDRFSGRRCRLPWPRDPGAPSRTG